jgi:Icc-related predicted phosphoesterase
MTRLFYATDIHGSELCFRKFVNAAKYYDADILILGGDLTGKMVVPIVRQQDGSFRVEFLGKDTIVRSKKEYDSLVASVQLNGMYPYETDETGMQKLQEDQEFVEELFTRLMVESIERWITFAQEKLQGTKVRMFMTGGNDDRLEVDQVLKSKASENVSDPDGDVVRIDEFHEMINCSYGNPTPWKTPREVSEEELERMIDRMVSKLEDTRNCIFNLHVPPINSGLDTCPKLDTSVFPPRPILEKGNPVTFGAGSVAVRETIEKCQPLLGLHGHIHESRGIRRFGKTLCINPGSEYSLGVVRGAIVTLDEKKVKGYQLTSG